MELQHHFNTEYAQQYGIFEAVLIYHFQQWILENKANNKHFFNGRYWTFNSINAFRDLFPYLPYHNIYRSLEKLVRRGVLIKGNSCPRDQIKCYALADEFINIK